MRNAETRSEATNLKEVFQYERRIFSKSRSTLSAYDAFGIEERSDETGLEIKANMLRGLAGI